MAVDLQAQPGEEVLLTTQLAISDTGLFPQSKIFNINDLDTVVETVNLDEIGNGSYGKVWTTPDVELKYWAMIIIYTDSFGGTASTKYRPTEIGINVNEIGGSTAFLFGGLQDQISKQKISLTKQDKVEIADMVKKTISADFVSLSQKQQLLEKLLDKLTLQVINLPKKRYDSELSSILSNVKKLESEVVSVSDLVSDIDKTVDLEPVKKMIMENHQLLKNKIESITVTRVENGVEVEIDNDLEMAKDLIKNPSKLKKGIKLNRRILNHILWLKGLT